MTAVSAVRHVTDCATLLIVFLIYCDLLAVPSVGLQCVIMVFPDHPHLFLLKLHSL